MRNPSRLPPRLLPTPDTGWTLTRGRCEGRNGQRGGDLQQAGDPASERRPTHGADRPRPDAWMLGGVVFAAIALVLVGFFHVVEGLSALFPKEITSSTPISRSPST
jgi:hypothetical protein